jgi:hypothetical protein
MTETLPSDPKIMTELYSSLEVEWYTLAHRCDACVSQSYFLVVFETGNLYFCNHHFKKNEAVIFEKAIDIVDESELLKS